MPRRALITGVTGQDGRLLARELLQMGYAVVGVTRDVAAAARVTAMPSHPSFSLAQSALATQRAADDLIEQHQPDEVYNLASQSSPEISWREPVETGDATGIAAHRIFEAVRRVKASCRVYQASSSEMFGDIAEAPQNEATPLHPVNPYAVAKVYAHNMARIYREGLGVFVSCGILFNHESDLRPMRYLTQRITLGAACARLGITECTPPGVQVPVVSKGKLVLGNLEARRDWGAAVDYVDAMWRMLQYPRPDDFVIGTGRARSVRELCALAYSSAGLDWADHVVTDSRLMRPLEPSPKVANTAKAAAALGWTASTAIESVLADMIARHVARLEESLA
jgi:GDPmannose 4,6-dehydratase